MLLPKAIRHRLAPAVAVVEACCCLLLGQWLASWVRFDRWERWIDRPVRPLQRSQAWDLHLAGFVARSIGRATGWLPFRTTCLGRAVAGRLMLRRRRVASVIHLGARPIAAGAGPSMEAHAWLSVHGQVLLGAEEAAGYSSLARYGDTG